MNTRYVAQLECGHPGYFDPSPSAGDTVYCRRCVAYTTVRVASDEWRWHCPQCHCSRSYGVNKARAVRTAWRHWRNTLHCGQVFKGVDLVETCGYDPDQLPLPNRDQ